MNIGNKSKLALKVLAVYGFLWLLTATWGNHDIDCDFDRKFSVGNDSGLGGPVVPVPIVRIHELANPKSLIDPKNKLPEYLWRYRGGVVVVGPFFIVDEIAYVVGGLGGDGEKRLTFWFFGYTKSFVVKYYWGV